MPFIPRSKPISWTQHARAKMNFYKLSPSRVRHVLHSPKRVEEGVAPKTIAMMQPASVKTTTGKASLGDVKKETWTHEIWVMMQDSAKERKIISAWRYPGVTKPKSGITKAILQQEYEEYSSNPKP